MVRLPYTPTSPTPPPETRYLGIGRTTQGRYVFTAFTLRHRAGATWLRPISARYMHAREIRHYQKEAAKAAD